MALSKVDSVVRYVVEMGQVDSEGVELGPQCRVLQRRTIMDGEVVEAVKERWVDKTLAQMKTIVAAL